MSFSIIPLGVNGAFTRTGFHTNYLIRSGAENVLLDCGPIVARPLAKQGIPFIDIDTVYISHMHMDHIGGLYELAMLRYLRELPPPKIYVHAALAEPLWNNFLLGIFAHYLDRSGKATEAQRETFFDFRKIECSSTGPSEPFSLGSLTARIVPVTHIPGSPCHGLILQERVFITTDTTFNPALLERMANQFGLETIFHDCTFHESNRVVHTTYEELKSLPEDLRDLIILTHYEDEIPIPERELELRLGQEGVAYKFAVSR